MSNTTQHMITTTLVLEEETATAFAVFAWSGLYKVAADEPHAALVRYQIIRHGIRASGIPAPD